mmetsp:Transcript_101123/g.286634  ORF Transcript_101123/g.286634 Transcript_101123/m.286634 type:complete len:254 (+) Transcript_101123:154-915(+)
MAAETIVHPQRKYEPVRSARVSSSRSCVRDSWAWLMKNIRNAVQMTPRLVRKPMHKCARPEATLSRSWRGWSSGSIACLLRHQNQRVKTSTRRQAREYEIIRPWCAVLTALIGALGCAARAVAFATPMAMVPRRHASDMELPSRSRHRRLVSSLMCCFPISTLMLMANDTASDSVLMKSSFTVSEFVTQWTRMPRRPVHTAFTRPTRRHRIRAHSLSSANPLPWPALAPPSSAPAAPREPPSLPLAWARPSRT